MTEKELLYIEDAIGHEQNIISICNESLNMLEDKNIISFLRNEIKHHKKIEESLICKLEENV